MVEIKGNNMGAMVWKFVSFENSYIEILTPKVMIVVGDGAFGRWLDHQSGALMNGITALIKQSPERSLTLFLL